MDAHAGVCVFVCVCACVYACVYVCMRVCVCVRARRYADAGSKDRTMFCEYFESVLAYFVPKEGDFGLERERRATSIFFGHHRRVRAKMCTRHAHTHTRTHTCIHTHARTYARTHKRAHAHTHMHRHTEDKTEPTQTRSEMPNATGLSRTCLGGG